MLCRKATRRLAAVAWLAAAALCGAAATQAQDAFQQGLDAYLDGEYQAALEHWRPAAESGDAVAAFNIGVLYAQGLGVEVDQAEAVRWYRSSAHAGYANAQFNLGAVYYNGEGTEVNLSQAVSWWERAAEQDHPEALYNLATLYRQGRGVPQDTRRAMKLFNRAASLGDARAQQALAEMGTRAAASDGGKPSGEPAAADGDARQGSRRAGASAAGGDPLADANPDHWTVQVFAGTEEQAARRFARDHGLTGSLRIYEAEIDGRTWFKGIYGSYADRGAAKAAQGRLARELPGSDPWIRSFRAIQAEAVGEALVMDAAREPSTAASQAPEQGASEPVEAAPPAGTAAPSGGGDAPAVADNNEEPAGDTPGGTASTGAGTEGGQTALRKGQKAFNAQNYDAAFESWRPLAEQGVAEAQYGVGFMYESGWGVERDYGKAFRWYQQAAQQGHVKAQYNLGMLYRNGQGVAQNDALGLYWIQTAADRGDERARDYLKELN